MIADRLQERAGEAQDVAGGEHIGIERAELLDELDAIGAPHDADARADAVDALKGV